MKEITCCFSGHRHIREEDAAELPSRLREAVVRLAENGVREFVCGGAVGFDMLAEKTVLDVRDEYPGVRLHLILPCRDQTKKWRVSDARAYREILERADEVEYLFDRYQNGCMQARNREMTERSKYLICYFDGSPGGTAGTVRYADKQGLVIINLA